MKYFIDTEVLKLNNLSLAEFGVLLYFADRKNTKSLEDLSYSLWEKGYLTKEVENYSFEVHSFEKLQKLIDDRGQKGLQIQRFKGLGEMMPQQLWETTMDPATRTLLKVNLEDAMLCDQLFDVLMGDKVEPRRDFIQTHAVYATNIDT